MNPAMAADRPAPAGSTTWQTLVVHDLKNALGALEGRLAAMVTAPTAEAADEAHRQCRDLRRRLVGFLLVQRGEADGGLPAWSTDESPSELLQSLAESPPWTRTDLALTCRIDEATPACWTFDRHLVRMALEAALHNAGRHAAHKVLLAARADRGGLLLEVLDDGPGPDTAAADADADAVSPERSTGLGTALCRAVAAAHRVDGRAGEVRLDAGGLPGAGPGARFSLWLP